MYSRVCCISLDDGGGKLQTPQCDKIWWEEEAQVALIAIVDHIPRHWQQLCVMVAKDMSIAHSGLM